MKSHPSITLVVALALSRLSEASPLKRQVDSTYSTSSNCSADSPYIISGVLAYNYTFDVVTGFYSNVTATTLNTSSSEQLVYASSVNQSTVFTFRPCKTTSKLTYPKHIPHDPIKAVYGHIFLQNDTTHCLKVNNALSSPLTASVEDCPSNSGAETDFGWFTYFGGNSPSLNPVTTGYGTNASNLFGVSDKNNYNVSLTNGSVVGPVLFNQPGVRLTFIQLDELDAYDNATSMRR